MATTPADTPPHLNTHTHPLNPTDALFEGLPELLARIFLGRQRPHLKHVFLFSQRKHAQAQVSKHFGLKVTRADLAALPLRG